MTVPVVLVTGLVGSERALTAADLEGLDVTMRGNGPSVRAADAIDAANPDPTATHCTVISQRGDYRASIPLDDLRTGGWLAFEREGAPLHGGPFRLTVAEGSTLCWNVKQVATLKLTSGPETDDIPEDPPH